MRVLAGFPTHARERTYVEQRMSLIIFNRSLNDDGDGDQEEAVEISLYNDVIYRDAISHDG